MPVIIGGNQIIPAPYVQLSSSYETLGDGRLVGNTITANVKGTIVAEMSGYTETPLQIEQRLSAIISGQKYIRSIFDGDGQWFEVQGLDGSQAVKFVAIVDSIDFQDGPWTDTCAWTVVLHGEVPAGEDVNGPSQYHIESASDGWQFQEGEGPHTYSVSHTVTAKGKPVYDQSGVTDTQPWEYARTFVTDQLTIGWNSTNSQWTPKSGSTIFTSGNIQPEATFYAYNRVISEQIDEADGTYSVTEIFTLSSNPYWEEYTISVRKETSNPLVTTTAVLSGTIHGMTSKLHDPEGKTAEAVAQWATVQTLLVSRVSAYIQGVNFNPKFSDYSYDINTTEGTVSYSCSLDDRILTNNTYEWYNVGMETSLEDGRTTVRIDGVIVGVRYYDDVYDPYLAFDRAWAQYQLVQNLMLVRCQNDSHITDLKAFPVSASVTPDKQGGQVSYSWTFDNRLPEFVKDEFNVSIRSSREDGRTIVTVSGTITGLRQSSPNSPFGVNNQFERYQNALTYFQGIQPNIIGLAGQYVDVSSVNPIPYSTTESQVPNAGQVTYEYEFNSLPKPCVTGALSENITIMDDAATPVIAIIPVLGRAAGPVFQDIGTVKEKRRTVTIEVVMPTNASTNMCSGTSPTFSVPVVTYAPTGTSVYVEQDQTQWSPSNGHYSRTVSWIYE